MTEPPRQRTSKRPDVNEEATRHMAEIFKSNHDPERTKEEKIRKNRENRVKGKALDMGV